MELAQHIIEIGLSVVIGGTGATVLVVACWVLIREMIGLTQDDE